MRIVAASAWVAEVDALVAAGYRCFDWLGCVDEIGRSDAFRVVLSLRCLERPDEPEMLLGTLVNRADPQLASLRGVFAGASWHEREVAELFGVRFVGGERRRLLLSDTFEGTPMRKDEVLAARTGVTWPGGKEPGEGHRAAEPPAGGSASPSRRRMVPPGVPDPAVWGDRDASAGDPDPAEVAESTVGGRVRRRR